MICTRFAHSRVPAVITAISIIFDAAPSRMVWHIGTGLCRFFCNTGHYTSVNVDVVYKSMLQCFDTVG